MEVKNCKSDKLSCRIPKSSQEALEITHYKKHLIALVRYKAEFMKKIVEEEVLILRNADCRHLIWQPYVSLDRENGFDLMKINVFADSDESVGGQP